MLETSSIFHRKIFGYLRKSSATLVHFRKMSGNVWMVFGQLSGSFRKSSAACRCGVYYINTNEIPSELSRENFISSHVKITCYFHTWRDQRRYCYIINRTFFTGVYNRYRVCSTIIDIMYRVCSTRCFTRLLRSLVRYRIEHSKIKFISTRGM